LAAQTVKPALRQMLQALWILTSRYYPAANLFASFQVG